MLLYKMIIKRTPFFIILLLFLLFNKIKVHKIKLWCKLLKSLFSSFFFTLLELIGGMAAIIDMNNSLKVGNNALKNRLP